MSALPGRKTWTPRASLERIFTTRCHIKSAEVHRRLERICDWMADVARHVVQASADYEAFKDIGPRVVHAWNDGMNSLRLCRTWSLPTLDDPRAQVSR